MTVHRKLIELRIMKNDGQLQLLYRKVLISLSSRIIAYLITRTNQKDLPMQEVAVEVELVEWVAVVVEDTFVVAVVVVVADYHNY